MVGGFCRAHSPWLGYKRLSFVICPTASVSHLGPRPRQAGPREGVLRSPHLLCLSLRAWRAGVPVVQPQSLSTRSLGLARVLLTNSWRFAAHIPAGSGNRKPNKEKKYRARDLKTQKRYAFTSGLEIGILLTSHGVGNGNRADTLCFFVFFN